MSEWEYTTPDAPRELIVGLADVNAAGWMTYTQPPSFWQPGEVWWMGATNPLPPAEGALYHLCCAYGTRFSGFVHPADQTRRRFKLPAEVVELAFRFFKLDTEIVKMPRPGQFAVGPLLERDDDSDD